jgi:transcription antitermination factor NusG
VIHGFQVDTVTALTKSLGLSQLLWFVAHTRPRQEKKLKAHCEQHGVAATLPCYKARHKYHGKTVSFDKPLFPGYVFLRLQPAQKDSVRQSDHVANLLEVADQETLQRQLEKILRALETGFEVRLAPTIGEGMRVRIKAGPLQGVEGLVEQRHDPSVMLLRLDFINQAAAVKLEADMLEVI